MPSLGSIPLTSTLNPFPHFQGLPCSSHNTEHGVSLALSLGAASVSQPAQYLSAAQCETRGGSTKLRAHHRAELARVSSRFVFWGGSEAYLAEAV